MGLWGAAMTIVAPEVEGGYTNPAITYVSRTQRVPLIYAWLRGPQRHLFPHEQDVRPIFVLQQPRRRRLGHHARAWRCVHRAYCGTDNHTVQA
jgi:hypothetical protein